MDTATTEMIKTITSDAIKILGPAIIAALATYKATQRQFEVQLKELEQTHEFGAREHLFKYYKDRQVQLAKDYEQLNRSLGELIGFATGYSAVGQKEEDIEFLSTIMQFANMYARTTPVEIETTTHDMERNGLKDTEDYKKLLAYSKSLQNLNNEVTLHALRRNVFIIVEAYHFLQHCNQALLQKQMEKVFTKYTELGQ